MMSERLTTIHQVLDNTADVLHLLEKGVFTKPRPGLMIKGGIRSWDVFHDEDAQIFMSTYDRNSEWPNHTHSNAVEYLIVSSGELEFSCMDSDGSNKSTVVLSKGQFVRVPTNRIHSAKALTDVKLIVVCIPPEKAYE